MGDCFKHYRYLNMIKKISAKRAISEKWFDQTKTTALDQKLMSKSSRSFAYELLLGP
jgi:hypothetical protein